MPVFASPILDATISAAPNVASFLAQAAPSVLQAHGFTAAEPELPADLSEASPSVSAAAFKEQIAHLPKKEVDDVTKDLLGAAHDSTKRLRDEQIRQARFTFNAAITLVVIGVLIIFAGVALLLFRATTTSASLTAALGGVTEVISALLFRFHYETNKRLDELGRQLSIVESARIAMTLIDRIEDPAKRDDAIRDAAKDLRAQGAVPTVSAAKLAP